MDSENLLFAQLLLTTDDPKVDESFHCNSDVNLSKTKS